MNARDLKPCLSLTVIVSEMTESLSPTLAAVWPEGLTTVEITFPLSEPEVVSSELERILHEDGRVYRRRSEELQFPLRSGDATVGYWGRVRLAPSSGPMADVGAGVVELEIFPEHGGQSPVPTEAVVLEHVGTLLEQVMGSDLEGIPALATCRLTLDLEDWRTAVVLPIKLPGVLDDASGNPEITGLQITFGDPTSELRRAEITTIPTLDHFYVEMMLGISLIPAHSLLHRTCDILSTHLKLLAIRVPSSEEVEHV